MLDKINSEREEHMITSRPHRVSSQSQEVPGESAKSMPTPIPPNSLRAAFAKTPSLLIGEMRDLETIESALRIAETATCLRHAAHQFRVFHHQSYIDVFPSHQAAPDSRAAFHGARGILCQALLPRR